MQQLREFKDAIERQMEAAGERRSEEEVVQALARASRDLLSRQTIHGDDRILSASYRLLWDHRRYFEPLFASMGFEIHYRQDYGYVLLQPGEIAVESRRGRIRKDETLVLFALRLIWEETSRDGDMDAMGRVETDSGALMDRYRILAQTVFPSLPRLREMMKDFKARGLVTLGEEDREEEVLPITVMPVIREIVTAQLAQEVMAYTADFVEGGQDVLEHLEEVRARPLAPEAPLSPTLAA